MGLACLLCSRVKINPLNKTPINDHKGMRAKINVGKRRTKRQEQKYFQFDTWINNCYEWKWGQAAMILSEGGLRHKGEGQNIRRSSPLTMSKSEIQIYSYLNLPLLSSFIHFVERDTIMVSSSLQPVFLQYSLVFIFFRVWIRSNQVKLTTLVYLDSQEDLLNAPVSTETSCSPLVEELSFLLMTVIE